MGVREGLIVATSTYADPQLNRLSAPGHDAQALSDVLSAPGIGNYTVHTALDQPTHVIRRKVQEFLVRRRTDDQLLIYFSCHGIKDDDGHLYFAGTDTGHDPDLLESSAVSAAFLSGQLNGCVARSIVVLLDCCYSGAFDPGAKSDASVNLRERFHGTGTAVITATNALQYAWEGDHFAETGQGQLSAFTSAIVSGLRTGDADLDGDGWVSVEDLYLHVNDRLLTDGARQTPHRWLLGGEGSLTIARSPGIGTAAPGGHGQQSALVTKAGESAMQAGSPQIAARMPEPLPSAPTLSGRGSTRPVAASPPPALNSVAPRRFKVGQWAQCVAFSPDGTHLATGSRHSIRIWALRDPNTTNLLWRRDFGGRLDTVFSVAFSPDGARVAGAGVYGTPVVWDAATGERLLMLHGTDQVVRVAFSPDGARVAGACRDGVGAIWDAATGQRLLTLSSRAGDPLYCVSFSPDGTRLATAQRKTVAVWDATTGKPLLFLDHDSNVVAFSPDGSRLVTTHCETVTVWGTATGDQLFQIHLQEKVPIVAFSPDGTRLATAHRKTAAVWDATTGNKLFEVHHDDTVLTVAFSPDGSRLATGSEDKTAAVWDISSSGR
ncbi:caspase family protein [Streptomyces sp. NBC_01142]|uniref:caspase, EACC1-associated type n=1 Tax=Streptomyces sp. NBC_01142 TaxID=2975865 RepID=UPI002256C734|nr:caspase family protein [Streptomyces sp. NBC_01142]MCX4826864.1 caspase family protein [Streptomyces sp. NBC_01142]